MAQIKFFKGGTESSLPENPAEGNIYVISNNRSDGKYQLGDIYVDINSENRLKINSGMAPEIKTTAEWKTNSLDRQQSIAGKIYIYSDHYERYNEEEEKMVKEPGIKIGDGNAYIVDLPFLPAVRKDNPDFLNTRITAFIELDEDQLETETLVLSY